jgi:predicted RNA binding protein YcfA (HicA-like mRNA interferase family)
MGRRYPPLKRVQIESILTKLNFAPKKTRGSHTQWEGYTKGKRRIVTVKKLKKDTEIYGPELMGRMIRQSGLTKSQFYSYL